MIKCPLCGNISCNRKEVKTLEGCKKLHEKSAFSCEEDCRAAYMPPGRYSKLDGYFICLECRSRITSESGSDEFKRKLIKLLTAAEI